MTIIDYKGMGVSDLPLDPDSKALLNDNFKLLADRTSRWPTDNEYYVKKGATASDADGSIARPYATIAACFTAIGDAADNTEWNDAAERLYRIHIGPGVWTETITNVPVRPWVHVLFEGSSCVGSWTRTFPQNLVSTGIGNPMLLFEGNSDRAGWDGSASFVHNGIVGDVNLVNNGQTIGSWFPMHQFKNFGVDGDVKFSIPAGTANQQCWHSDTFISGVTDNTGAQGLTLFATGGVGNEILGDIEGVGGFTGNVNLFFLNNVLISQNSSPTGSIGGANWYNTRLLDSATLDFSGSSQSVGMDANTHKEYLAGNDGEFTGTVSLLDAHASSHVHDADDEIDGDVVDINYVPTNYTRSTTPTEVTSVEELTAHLAGVDDALGTVGDLVRTLQFFADQMVSTTPTNFPVAVTGAAQADSIANDLTVRVFDNVTEEGVGIPVFIPTGATTCEITFVSRPMASPGGVRTVGVDLYNREVGDGVAISAWNAGVALTDLSFPNTTNPQYDVETITLSDHGIEADKFYNLEFVRTQPGAGTELAADWGLFLISLKFG